MTIVTYLSFSSLLYSCKCPCLFPLLSVDMFFTAHKSFLLYYQILIAHALLREMGMGRMTLELAARRTGAGRDEAEGARIALASPDTRPEIAVAVAITIGARRARVLLFSPLFLLYYCPSLSVLLFAV